MKTRSLESPATQPTTETSLPTENGSGGTDNEMEPKCSIKRNETAAKDRKKVFYERDSKNVLRDKKKNMCDRCDKVFLGVHDLKKHMRVHNNERPYQCKHCDKRFRQAGCLKNHVASQHGTDEVFICYYCNKSFPIKERLRLHMRLHSGVKPYKCTQCSKEFARGGQLSQHLLTHNGIKKYRCDYCPAAFSCTANVKLHMKAHLGERDYTCHMCGKSFLRPDALKKHLICYHGDVKAFHCNVCDKKFKGHLPQHMRTHNNERPHGCSDCGATFSQRSQLNVHQRVHSGERPYRCQVCWQAFAHSSVLKLHIRKHTGEKPFKCPLCKDSDIAFSQLPHLKTHMRSIHGKDKSYMCSQCSSFFKTKYELQQHKQTCKLSAEENGDFSKSIKNSKFETSDGSGKDLIGSMPLTKMRLLIAVLIKKISSEDRLKMLGFDKRLIDNVLIGALKIANRNSCEDVALSEADRLKANIQEFLEWTLPASYMDKFKEEQRSMEEILEELTSNTKP